MKTHKVAMPPNSTQFPESPRNPHVYPQGSQRNASNPQHRTAFAGPDGTRGTRAQFRRREGRFCPFGPLVLGSKGSLYGGTGGGGSYRGSDCRQGRGTVFQLTPQVDGRWNEAILRSFVSDDGRPWSPILQDAIGNLYGTTEGGPISDSEVFELTRPRTAGSLAYSTAMSLSPASHRQHWKSPRGHRPRPAQYAAAIGKPSRGSQGSTYTLLYSYWGPFSCPDGVNEPALLVWDANGNLFSVTSKGAIGQPACTTASGCGDLRNDT